MPTLTRHTGNLQGSLLRLDGIIRAAVECAEGVFGSSAARDSFRGLYVNDAEFERLLSLPPAEPLLWSAPPGEGALTALAQEFGLEEFDCDVLLIALAVELDLKYERLFGYLQDDVTRKRPTVDLALHLLCPTAESRIARRAHFTANAPLIASGLMKLVPDPAHTEPPLLAHYLRLEESAVSHLTRQSGLDARLALFCRAVDPRLSWDDTVLDDGPREALIAFALRARLDQRSMRLFFEGVRGAGQAETAEALAGEAGQALLIADLERAVECRADIEAVLPALFREARFRRAVLYMESADGLPRCLLESLAENRAGIMILSGLHAPPQWFSVSFRTPGSAASRRAWRRAAEAESLQLESSALETLSGRLRMTPEQVNHTVQAARSHALWRGAAEPATQDFLAAARAYSGQNLSALARKVDARHRWDDIVLPPDTAAQLREMCSRVEHRRRVLDEWGFGRKLSRGTGVNALFSGPSGSGKTMAAEVISSELQLDAYRIDLSGVVSKYIGETEKNLDRIFAAAENANAILFFDEADALFGKRSEVRDSHDRYANIEISYLLQKMEEYDGIAILATNLRQNLDDSFVRRLTFSLHFPFPDEDARRRIWQRIWPADLPLADDIDPAALARQLKLSGGNIRNIALAAAFAAAENNEPVSLEHVLHAARREYQKFGKQLLQTELRAESLQEAAR